MHCSHTMQSSIIMQSHNWRWNIDIQVFQGWIFPFTSYWPRTKSTLNEIHVLHARLGILYVCARTWLVCLHVTIYVKRFDLFVALDSVLSPQPCCEFSCMFSISSLSVFQAKVLQRLYPTALKVEKVLETPVRQSKAVKSFKDVQLKPSKVTGKAINDTCILQINTNINN